MAVPRNWQKRPRHAQQGGHDQPSLSSPVLTARDEADNESDKNGSENRKHVHPMKRWVSLRYLHGGLSDKTVCAGAKRLYPPIGRRGASGVRLGYGGRKARGSLFCSSLRAAAWQQCVGVCLTPGALLAFAGLGGWPRRAVQCGP